MSKAIAWLAGGVVAVAAATVGGMVVTGNGIERRMTTGTRAALEPFAPLVTVQDLTYEKTLTGATRTLTLKFGCDGDPTSITWRDRVRHGPFPGLRSLAIAVVDSELVLSDHARAQLKERLGIDGPPVTVHTVVDLGGDASGDLVVPKLSSRLPDGTRLEWGAFTLHTQQSGPQWRYEARLPALEIAAPDQGFALHLVDYHAAGEYRAGGLWWAHPGNGTAELKSLAMSGRTPQGRDYRVLAHDVRVASSAAIDHDLLTAGSRFAGSLEVDGHRIDRVEWQSSIRRLHVPTLDGLLRTMLGKEMLSGVCQGAAAKQALQERSRQMLADMPGKLLNLLPYGPEYRLDKLAITYEGAQATFDYALGVAGVSHDDIQSGSPDVPALMKKLVASAHLRLPKAWLQQAAAAAADQGKPVPTGEQLDAALAPVVEQGYVIRDGDFLDAQAELKGGKLTVNGKPVPVPGMPGDVE